MKTNFISYADAVKRFDNSLVLCNNITEVDTMMWENMWGNFYQEDEETLVDIYQYYITDCTQDEVESLVKWYDLKFLYSEMLDCFVLCVDHWGTRWSGVMIEDKSAEE
jgi:hypothetical protein